MGDNWKTHAKNWASQGWRVHLIDQRNHGRSFGLPILVMRKWQKIYAIISMKISLNKPLFWGILWEWKVAMLFACLYPEKVEQLIVADIAPKTYPPHHQTI